MADAFEKLQKTVEKHEKKGISNILPPSRSYEEQFHSELSMLSLILGVFGLILPLFNVLAVLFGMAGLMQVNREKMKGRWMAITGISLGFLGIFILVAAIILGVSFFQGVLTQFAGIEAIVK
ncbi:hypothetical protein COV20_02100 [Candidatus Woesearchaeota archaeon CG10_big_fil_rev_8_21_14_0_10_45_16]|nr:MAG: hypothetical protein COV20_02100 [Candidatus Woesearchaeota archaeon CG10_big_fil_rev_8_21_14_0_10_45_16]